MFYVGEFRANLVVYRFCEVLSYKKWTLAIFNKHQKNWVKIVDFLIIAYVWAMRQFWVPS